MELQIDQEKKRKTELILPRIYNLPGVPKVMFEVNKLLDEPSTTTTHLRMVTGKDQGLATKILSIANSPLYGLPRKVSTIDFAILIIGFQDIKNIVTALSMIESFKNKTDKNLNQQDFWTHSVLTGNAAKRISEDLGYRIGGEVFVAGLLHDLGIPVIHKFLHSSFLDVIDKAVSTEISYTQAEYDVLGLSHQEIGKFLAEPWNLPPSLCDTILVHQKPSKASENKILASIVHLADYMYQKLEIGNFYWDEKLELDESILSTLQFRDNYELETFIMRYKDLFREELNTIGK